MDTTLANKGANAMAAQAPNPQFHNERMAVQAAYDALGEAIEALRQQVHRDTALQALVHPLPYQGTGDDGYPAGIEAWDDEPLTGDDARLAAMREIARTRCHYNQHPATVTRAPGLIGASEATLARVDELNAAKEHFFRAVQAISPRKNTRSRELHAMIPRVSLMQIRRKLVHLAQKPDRLTLTWIAHTSSVRAIAAGELDRELERRLAKGVPDHVDGERWRAIVGYARERLAELPETEVVAIRTPMPPHVRANIYWGRKTRTVNASLPLFFPDDGGEAVAVKALPAFHQGQEGYKRSDRKLEDEPLASGLGLYRYRREHRRRE